MDHFFNEAGNVVDEMLDGIAHRSKVMMAEAGHGVRILLRADWAQEGASRGRVAVLSGGGAGHEPAHAGYVGQGMLSGAISGDVFASPSVEAVLAAIREACGEAGCLLVVKNYTGDRLNFGLAAERARQEGYKVAMVIVADDIALPDAPQPRGIAGTLLVHKVAGYYAEQGASLDDVKARAQETVDQLASMAMALSSCTLPGHEPSPREPELGLGIHNETGAKQVTPENAADAMRMVIEPLLARIDQRYGKDTPCFALLNNLGSCSTQEMDVLCHELIRQVTPARLKGLLGPAPLMTSLDMHGFSVTLIPCSASLEEALYAPTSAPGWPGLRAINMPVTFRPRMSMQDGNEARPQNDARRQVLERVANVVLQSQQALDALDAKSGDGDAGSTFAAGAHAVLRKLESRTLNTQDDRQLFDELGRLFALEMGGSSGVLLSILFTATGTALSDGAAWGEALMSGVERMQHYGGANPGDRTMLDALIPAIEALGRGESLQQIAVAARRGADSTAEMHKANAGRSAYVPENALAGVIDPGAEGVARVFEALAG